MRFFLLIPLIVTIGISSPAMAHKTTIFAWVDGDMVHTQSKFAGGRKAKNAKVQVYDDKGIKLLEGKTDEKGEYSFKIPKRAKLKVVILAGAGHRGEWTIPLSELEGGGGNVSGVPHLKIQTEEKKRQQQQLPPLSSRDIQAAVEKALDKKLKPIAKMLSESRQQGTSITDIISGIGYILGLVGIAAYINYRKKKTGVNDS